MLIDGQLVLFIYIFILCLANKVIFVERVFLTISFSPGFTATVKEKNATGRRKRGLLFVTQRYFYVYGCVYLCVERGNIDLTSLITEKKTGDSADRGRVGDFKVAKL